ncbi:hypothetical protein ACFSX9_07495 [Flavobacterium ardleyense]|uniref:Uncharacterized protein n=1 Tax=Flavobacterium ardleyense TaxID=2038737 RepID=A0ABW5Z784_9FLAO
MRNYKKILVILFVAFGLNTTFAKAKIPFGNREVITIVAELPDNEMYESTEGSKEYLELATLHEEFNIAWILPLWITKEPKLVLYNEKGEVYYDVPEAEMDELLAENKISKDDVLKVPFYNKYGGKIILALLIGLFIWGSIGKKDSVEAREV